MGRVRGVPRWKHDLPLDRELGLVSGFTLPVVTTLTRLCAQMAFASARDVFGLFAWSPAASGCGWWTRWARRRFPGDAAGRREASDHRGRQGRPTIPAQRRARAKARGENARARSQSPSTRAAACAPRTGQEEQEREDGGGGRAVHASSGRTMAVWMREQACLCDLRELPGAVRGIRVEAVKRGGHPKPCGRPRRRRRDALEPANGVLSGRGGRGITSWSSGLPEGACRGTRRRRKISRRGSPRRRSDFEKDCSAKCSPRSRVPSRPQLKPAPATSIGARSSAMSWPTSPRTPSACTMPSFANRTSTSAVASSKAPSGTGGRASRWPGMRWGRDRAEAVLHLRCVLLNGRGTQHHVARGPQACAAARTCKAS